MKQTLSIQQLYIVRPIAASKPSARAARCVFLNLVFHGKKKKLFLQKDSFLGLIASRPSNTRDTTTQESSTTSDTHTQHTVCVCVCSCVCVCVFACTWKTAKILFPGLRLPAGEKFSQDEKVGRTKQRKKEKREGKRTGFPPPIFLF